MSDDRLAEIEELASAGQAALTAGREKSGDTERCRVATGVRLHGTVVHHRLIAPAVSVVPCGREAV